MSESRRDASDQRPARVGVHEDQTILVAAQKAGGFCHAPGNIGTRNADEKKDESLSARAGRVRDVDN